MTRFSLFIVVALSLPVVLLARQQNENRIIFGVNVITPETRGEITGPNEIVQGDLLYNAIDHGTNITHSYGLIGFSLGAYVDYLRTAFVMRTTLVQGSPGPRDAGLLELSCRYSFLDLSPVTLEAIATLKRFSPGGREDREYGGYIMRDNYWTPGLGIGLTLSIIHAEALVHAWPHLKIEDAAVPTGGPLTEYGQIPYTLEPVYLKYDVSLMIGFEFNVAAF